MIFKLPKWLVVASAVLLVVTALLLSGITIPLDFLDSRLESLAGRLLDRNVSIHGPVHLKTSLYPSLKLGGLTIGNPRGWPEESGHLLIVEKSRAQISLMDLLRGKVNILDLEFTGVDLQLVTKTDQTNNYQFSLQSSNQEKTTSKHELSSLERLSLKDLKLSYLDEFSGKQYTLEIDEAHGQGKAGNPLQVDLSGTFNETPCTLHISGGTLTDLLAGKDSWPLAKGRLTLADFSLGITGSLNMANKGVAGYMALAFEGHSLDAIGQIFDLSLPDIGEFSFQTRAALLPGMVQFTNTQLIALNNTVEGDLVLSLHGERPSLGGTIRAASLTPEVMTVFQASDQEEKIRTEPAAAEEKLPWEILQLMDSDLLIRLDSAHAAGLQVNNLQAVFSLFDGELIMPVSMSVMDLPITAQFEIYTSNSVPTIAVDVLSPGGDLDPLFERMSKEQDLNGQLGEVSFKSSSRGNTFAELLKGVDIELFLGPTILKQDSMVVVATQALSLERKHQQSFLLSAMGEYLGSPFNLDAEFGRSKDPSKYAGSSVHLQLTACDTELIFDGGEVISETGESTFSLMIDGEKLCGFLHPVEQFFGKNSSYSLMTTGALKSGLLSVDVQKARLGDLDLYGHINLQTEADGNPFVSGVINSKRIDIARILGRTDIDENESSPESSPGSEQTASVEKAFEQKIELLMKFLAMEIKPIRKFLATDVQVQINLEELITGLVNVSDIGISIEALDGKLKHSPFQAKIGGSLFTGSAAIDATATVPSAHLDLATDDFSLPELLKDFTISKVPDVSAEHVGWDLSLKGKTIKDMLQQATYLAELRNGRIVLPREPLEPLVVNLDQGNYADYPGQPARMSLEGDINSHPVFLEMLGEGVFAKGTERPVVLSAQAGVADTRLEIDGQVNRKKDSEESFRLSTVLYGNRMDGLNQLLGINMPPLGPYQIEGTLASKGEKSIGLYDMGVQIGDSILKGEAILSAISDEQRDSGAKANVQTKLRAETIQLNDFQFENWSPFTGSEQESENGGQEESGMDQSNNRLYDIFSADIAGEIDGALEIHVREVLSGTDDLGNGQLNARLEDGRYILDDLRLDVPGGTIHIEGMLLPENDKIATELLMKVKHFDYGILARRNIPDSTLKGEVNLLLDLNAHAETSSQLREHMSGRLRFGVVPEEFKAGVLDLWTVNILTAVLPALLKGSSSVVNCLAGDFIAEDGIMHPEVFILDTSKMRVQGKGEVDFKTNSIDFRMNPTPKSAQFFSLATPITVSGTIFDPDIGVTPAGVIGTLFRQAASIVTVPLKWVFSDSMEADGTKVCSAAMQWAQEDVVEQQQ